MKTFGNKGLGAILKVLLQIGFCFGVVILLMLPYLLKFINESLDWYWIMVYPTGILFLIIKLMNIAKYASLGISSFIIIEVALVLTMYQNKNIVFLIFLAVLFFGVFIALHILKEILYQAILYKEENELTI